MSTTQQKRRKRNGEQGQSNSRVWNILHDAIGVGLFVYKAHHYGRCLTMYGGEQTLTRDSQLSIGLQLKRCFVSCMQRQTGRSNDHDGSKMRSWSLKYSQRCSHQQVSMKNYREISAELGVKSAEVFVIELRYNSQQRRIASVYKAIMKQDHDFECLPYRR